MKFLKLTLLKNVFFNDEFGRWKIEKKWLNKIIWFEFWQRQDDNGDIGLGVYGGGVAVRPYPHRDYTLHLRPNSGASTASDTNNGIFSSISNSFNSLVSNIFGWSFAYRPTPGRLIALFTVITLSHFLTTRVRVTKLGQNELLWQSARKSDWKQKWKRVWWQKEKKFQYF